MLSDLASSSSNDAIYIDSKMDIERIESPIQSGIPMVIRREEKIKYKSLLIPNGMRSAYWNYFGFPSEDGRTYLTKQKVVCALCSTLLAYNKNTTNLKSHLKSKHRDVVKNSDLIIRSKKEVQKMIKIEPIDFKIDLVTSMSPTSSNTQPESQTDLLVDDLEFEPGEIPEPNDNGNLFIIDDENSCTSNNLADELSDQYDEIHPEMLNITSSGHSIVDDNNIYTIDLMTDIIVTDLLPISTISGTGFKNLLYNCLPQPIPQTFEIEAHITRLVEKRKSTVQNNIENLTKTKQFAIILNKFKIYTQEEYLVVFVNFINIQTIIQKFDLKIEMDVSKIERKCYVYNIVPIRNTEVNYGELLTNLNLEKCNSIIINYFNDSSLNDYLLDNNLNNNKIIVAPDFLDIIKNLIKNIFCSNNSGMSTILKELCVSTSGNYNNWYSRWMMLENYLTRNLNNCDDELSNLVGMLIDCLRPLKVTLELLQNDDIIPNASLIKPLIMQLLQNHFKLDYENDHSIIHEIKEMVNMELNSRLIDTPILSVFSFLDPRFTHLLTSSEIEYVREFLRQKWEENISDEEKTSAKKFVTANKPTSSKGIQSSGLDYFFMLKNPKVIKSYNKFDHDFDKFMNEAATSLEQCPISWWAEFGYFYPTLSQLAKIYTNIPACYLEQHKIGSDEYFKFHKKRYLLDECTDNVLYLHLTESLPWI